MLIGLAAVAWLATATPAWGQNFAVLNWNLAGDNINGQASQDTSGDSVSISADGTRIAIGAPNNNAGHVQIYELHNNTWTQLGNNINGQTQGDRAGTSVSMSADGTRIAIGAPNNNAGHVQIYELHNNTWTQLGNNINGEATDDASGGAVSLSADGSRVAIGAERNDADTGRAYDRRGHVRIYQLAAGTWDQVCLLYTSDAADE